MTNVQRFFLIGGFAIIFCATGVWGQTNILQGDIPFPFHVGEKHFASGHYDVMIGFPNTPTVTVRPSSGDADAVGHVIGGKTQDSSALQSKLVFTKYGKDEYFLSEIWHPGISNSMTVLKSDHELVTSKLVAALRPEKVEIWAAVRFPR